jgi:hypothetical protein
MLSNLVQQTKKKEKKWKSSLRVGEKKNETSAAHAVTQTDAAAAPITNHSFSHVNEQKSRDSLNKGSPPAYVAAGS